MMSGNYGTGRRRVTWSIFELGLIVHGRFVFISTGDYAGSRHGEGKSMPKTGLQSLSQGSWIRAWSGEGRAGSRHGVPKMETKVVEDRDTRWKVLEGAWVVGTRGSEFQCCTECNTYMMHSYKYSWECMYLRKGKGHKRKRDN